MNTTRTPINPSGNPPINPSVARPLAALMMAAMMLPLGGCAAIYTGLVRSDLEVSSKMSDSIFLDPVPAEERTVYVDIRNTSDKRLDLASLVKVQIGGRGYKVVNNPNQANYWLQANVLYVGEANLTAAEAVLEDGFGGALTSAGLLGVGAAAAVEASGQDSQGVATAVGVAVGAASFLADVFVRDVTFSVVTDIRLSERTGDSITTRRESRTREGSRGESVQRSTSRGNRKFFETRVLTTARQVNLTYEDAETDMTLSLAAAIGGLF